MARFSLIHPIDQPTGRRRLLHDLKSALRDERFTDFRLIVAYAKSGPLYRLQEPLKQWRRSGKSSSAILGLDQQGTSKDALELALSLFDCVYVTRESGITFHPKIYLFKGNRHAEAFIGSNNLTVGGTEKNFEAAVHLKFDLPINASELDMIELSWSELLPASCPATEPLDSTRLAQMVADNVVIEEKAMRAGAGDDVVTSAIRGRRSGLLIKPESPLPPRVPAQRRRHSIPRSVSIATRPATARCHVIQIKPHHNGEIFLSYAAVMQNPDFFDWPFNGRTTPKKPGNPSYPQLDPDPIVNITVFSAGPEPIQTLYKYSLNTVYYENKREIRITASPLVHIVPEYSVMIIERSGTPGISYEITIHTPESPDYEGWVAACDQEMPGGGRRPRRFGWF